MCFSVIYIHFIYNRNKMKKVLIISLASLLSGSVMAQDMYDVVDITSSDLNGTARYVGMGGALSALGGDLTTMGTNPAGTGIFRRGEIAVTGGGLITSEKGQMGHDRTRASLDQAGIVFPLSTDTEVNGLNYVNFGVNYRKSRNSLSNMMVDVQNLGGVFSQTNQIADLANRCANSTGNWGMLADMAAPEYDKNGNLSKDGIIVDYYDSNTGKLLNYQGVGAQSAAYSRASYGSTTQCDFNVSFNVADKVFLGLSLGVYDYRYDRESFYKEVGTDGGDYDFTNWYKMTGDGFDVKLGAIWRPFEGSPFRIGAYIHSPIWYKMTEENGSLLYYKDNFVDQRSADPYDYDFRTPWKFGVSMGHTIDKILAFGVDYEYSDLGSSHYDAIDGVNSSYFAAMNNLISKGLKGQHTLRLGMEMKPADNFAIRLGYNYVSAPIEKDAYKTIAYDGPFTETDFVNWKDINRVTFGLGYRFKGGYFDVAYQYQMQKGDFYAFDEVDLKPTSVENNRSQLMATLGFRF